eukprot:3432327-Prymnesium_polylepis.1
MEERKEALRRAALEEAELNRLTEERKQRHGGATVLQAVARSCAIRVPISNPRSNQRETRAHRAGAWPTKGALHSRIPPSCRVRARAQRARSSAVSFPSLRPLRTVSARVRLAGC